MKTFLKIAFSLLLLPLFACAASAEQPTNVTPSVSFAAFPLPLLRTYLSSAEGLSAKKAEMDSPFPNDFPPSTVIALEDARSYPSLKKGSRYFFPSRNILRAYRISEAEKAHYKTILPQISLLRKILQERPASIPAGYTMASGNNPKYVDLPDYPSRNAAHAFQLKLSYLDAEWGSGIFYITQFTQDGGTAANNEELTYLFQGVSKDGSFYVSADFRITNPKLPSGIDSAQHSTNDDYLQDELLLSKQPDNSFSPSLAKIREWVASIKIE